MAKRRDFTALTQKDCADMHGVDVRTIRRWDGEGHPRNDDATYSAPESIRWRIEHEMKGLDATAARAWRDREAATKLALANARERGRLIYADQVAEVLTTLAADLSARHDALPGRLAGELAGETDAAVIRSRLLDELRNVRAAFADASQTLADKLGDA